MFFLYKLQKKLLLNSKNQQLTKPNHRMTEYIDSVFIKYFYLFKVVILNIFVNYGVWLVGNVSDLIFQRQRPQKKTISNEKIVISWLDTTDKKNLELMKIYLISAMTWFLHWFAILACFCKASFSLSSKFESM